MYTLYEPPYRWWMSERPWRWNRLGWGTIYKWRPHSRGARGLWKSGRSNEVVWILWYKFNSKCRQGETGSKKLWMSFMDGPLIEGPPPSPQIKSSISSRHNLELWWDERDPEEGYEGSCCRLQQRKASFTGLLSTRSIFYKGQRIF